MSHRSTKDIAAIIRDGTAIDRAIEEAGYNVVRRHRQLALPLVIWQDGRVVEVPPESVWIPDDGQLPGDPGRPAGSARAPTSASVQQKAAEMAQKKTVTIWYDQEADYLEVIFDPKAGSFRETASDSVMVKVDEQGNVLGFPVLKLSAPRRAPLEVTL